MHLNQEIEKTGLDIPSDHETPQSVSISLPISPTEVRMNDKNKRVNFSGETIFYDGTNSSKTHQTTTRKELPKSVKFHSQPMPKASTYNAGSLAPIKSTGRIIDRRFDSFKTFSGRFERQITQLRGGGERTQRETRANDVSSQVDKILSVDRYFDALQGPELDTLRVMCSSYSYTFSVSSIL